MPRSAVAPIVATLAWVAGSSAAAGEIAPQLLNAQYVALGYDLGDRVLSASEAVFEPGSLTPEDRELMEAVRAQLEAWNHFVIVDRVAWADLVIAIRAGRGGTLRLGAAPGRGEDPRSRSVGAALSSRDDTLSVFEAEGSDIPLWRRHAPEGLSGEQPLLQAFRAELEAASPN